MNMPNIPTDNLYKFIAISGLVLVVATFLKSHQLENDLIRKEGPFHSYMTSVISWQRDASKSLRDTSKILDECHEAIKELKKKMCQHIKKE